MSTIESGRAVVGVIGLGYVGLPLAAAMHDAGLRVLGVDTDPKKIDALARGAAYIHHLGADLPRRLASSGRFEPTGDLARLAECDAVLVCVPTPLRGANEPDLSFVLRTGGAIGRTLRPGQLVILCSTTYPGTTRDEFAPAIARASGDRTGERIGEDWFCAYSPEREDPGSATHTTRTIPRLVGGLDERSGALAAALLRRAVDRVILVRNAEIAEAAKLLENVFRAVNIALVNELKVALNAMGIDVWEVIRAAATKPFGFMPFWPGPGLGGHCIPIDPFYLAWKARRAGQPVRFIELAGEINLAMPGRVVERLARALQERGGRVRGARVLVLGVAYKPDIDDVRESPAFVLMDLLRDAGATVDYSDPHVPETWPGRRHPGGMRSVPITPQTLASYDAVVIVTAHRMFDYALIARHARVVIDTRDAMREHEEEMGDRLVRA